MGTIRTFSEVQQALGVALLFPVTNSTSVGGVSLTGLTAQAWALLEDSFVFQYFPASLNDSQDVNYQTIDIPGGSHPIYQWVSGGPRTISFQAQFTQERIVPPGVADVTNRRNVSINAALAALRFFYYPDYSVTAALRAQPPVRLKLVIPGTQLSGKVFDPSINVILTGLNPQITAWHAAGVPRMATVDLTFNEHVQSPTGGVQFIGRENFRVLKLGYNPIVNAGRRAAAG